MLRNKSNTQLERAKIAEIKQSIKSGRVIGDFQKNAAHDVLTYLSVYDRKQVVKA